MTRLINHMRASIINQMLQNAFGDKVVLLMDKQVNIAEDIYNNVYDRAARERLNSAPEGWLPMNESIKISIVGKDDYTKAFRFDGALEMGNYSSRGNTESECYSILKPEDRKRDNMRRRVAYKHNGSVIVKNYDPSDPIANAVINWIDEQRAVSVHIHEARKLAIATMDAFTTVEKLIEGWPEVEPFTRNYQAPAPVQLPAIPIGKLNGMLGLPVSE